MKGHMAPEWALSLPITAKVDVYRFGIVILDIGVEEQEVELIRLVGIVKMKIRRKEECWMEDIVDPRLNGEFNGNQAAALVEMRFACMEEDRSKRPTMDAIVQVLLECVADHEADLLAIFRSNPKCLLVNATGEAAFLKYSSDQGNQNYAELKRATDNFKEELGRGCSSSRSKDPKKPQPRAKKHPEFLMKKSPLAMTSLCLMLGPFVAFA
ncbi:hypothetical protein RJ640_014347 [Escallonia rubra]|uniref:Uncharacterized protein n=1 Tax=Escallonia rubra TaxID=112253 RepID=A0AA88QKC6_9ASTE|nr:hypothetical protein RJ640_014347 [Escallonia rubra]